jgi:membrane dipeptidase
MQECYRLGIVVDLAYASHKILLDALKVVTEQFIVSQTNIDTWTGKNLCMAEMMPLLISKEQTKIVVEAEGVICVWTHLTDSLQKFVKSIRAIVETVG